MYDKKKLLLNLSTDLFQVRLSGSAAHPKISGGSRN